MPDKKSPQADPPGTTPSGAGSAGSEGATGADDGPGKPPRFGLAHRLRNYFLAGVLVTAPIGITVYLAWVFITFIDSRVTPLLPAPYRPETYLPIEIPGLGLTGLGLIILVVGLILIGALTAGLFGRLILRAGEGILARVPVIRSVYGAAKQITETVLASQSTAFRQVVLFEYPRRGLWALGFITGSTKGEVQNLTADEVANVFLPTTPNPTSGFLLFVPRKDLVVLTMTVEEGIKMVVSGGIITPPDRRLPEEREVKVVRAAGGDTPTIGPGPRLRKQDRTG
jgi:uncharacterized membrane protein